MSVITGWGARRLKVFSWASQSGCRGGGVLRMSLGSILRAGFAGFEVMFSLRVGGTLGESS